jgi:hypothetical protein
MVCACPTPRVRPLPSRRHAPSACLPSMSRAKNHVPRPSCSTRASLHAQGTPVVEGGVAVVDLSSHALTGVHQRLPCSPRLSSLHRGLTWLQPAQMCTTCTSCYAPAPSHLTPHTHTWSLTSHLTPHNSHHLTPGPSPHTSSLAPDTPATPSLATTSHHQAHAAAAAARCCAATPAWRASTRRSTWRRGGPSWTQCMPRGASCSCSSGMRGGPPTQVGVSPVLLLPPPQCCRPQRVARQVHNNSQVQVKCNSDAGNGRPDNKTP